MSVRFAVAAFLEPVALDAELDPEELPLNVVLLDAARTDAGLGEVEAALERALAGFAALTAVAGDDELVPGAGEATLLEEAEDFTGVHRALVAELRPLGVRVERPERVGASYRPRVAATDSDRLDRGDEVEARAVALLDLSEPGVVRVAAQFPLI